MKVSGKVEKNTMSVDCIWNSWLQVIYRFFKLVVMMGIQGGNLSNLSLSLGCGKKITKPYMSLMCHFSLQQVDRSLPKICCKRFLGMDCFLIIKFVIYSLLVLCFSNTL